MEGLILDCDDATENSPDLQKSRLSKHPTFVQACTNTIEDVYRASCVLNEQGGVWHHRWPDTQGLMPVEQRHRRT